ncbi:MAG TPA: RbsD/FucU domain-containing protein, partial [Acetobacteraceae bacterium]
MLIGLDPLLTPDLLHALASMGHGESIALVDANYPATRGRRLVRLPGTDIVPALHAVLSLLPLDSFIPNPAATMQVVNEPGAVPRVVAAMNAVLAAHGHGAAAALERHEFYAAAEAAYCLVQTGVRRFYGNILLTKGVIPPK